VRNGSRIVIACLLAVLAGCEESRPADAKPPGAWVELGPAAKAPPDPRLVCPPGTTQQRFESPFEAGAVTLWCEDERQLTQGPRREWYANGRLASDMPYRDGHPEGVARTWYSDGVLEREAPRRNGKLDGRDRRWHPNGKLKAEVLYKADWAVGIGRFWDERGRLVRTRDYAKNPQPPPDSTDLLR
jgi:MORN repeat protein